MRFWIWAIFSAAAFAEIINIEVLDATIKDKRIEGAEAIIQQDDEASVKARTNAAGKARINARKKTDENTILIIKKSGFSDLIANCPCDSFVYALSPVLTELDSIRAVLTWGETPKDLDAHLFFGANHIAAASKSANGAKLDVDDKDGFGPETITIAKKVAGDRYVYAVQNFTDENSDASLALARSGAKVFLYVGQTLVKIYSVPNKEGTIWEVFTIGEHGEIEDLNYMTYTSASRARSHLASEIERLKSGSTTNNAPDILYIDDAIAIAEKLNKEGENAYRSGNTERAIAFYQGALAQYEAFAQAYNNLSLAYMKQKKFAETIWAQHRAIAISKRNKDNARVAASYYNIGQIYEDFGDLTNALRYYELAKNTQDRPTYSRAISRVKELSE
ncbi:MAG: tetratricopeptide repeat protein [Helicobacteraceae bacterium]|jgi:tetratricopeptide (TPR) repeat protein|nr:tetratricopeptide repeat protein [Helicobacteraceae bacterium]